MSLNSLLPSTTTDHHHHHHHRRHHSLQDQPQKLRSPKKKKPPPPSPRSITTPKHTTPKHTNTSTNTQIKKKKQTITVTQQNSSSQSSWEQFKSLLSCRSTTVQVHEPNSLSSKLGRAACGSSLCAFRDVVHGNTRVVHRPDNDLTSVSDVGSISQHETAPLTRSVRGSSSARHLPQPPSVYMSGCGGYSRGGMPLRKLSGCYECHAVNVDPASRRYPRPRTLSVCQECGEVFTKAESLELHQAIRHAVSELGPEDSGRNIVEIIFKSSWQKRDHPVCMIERILKVHNTPRTIARFEDYRAAVKSRALPSAASRHLINNNSSITSQPTKKNPRCAADGNELLRFHCTTLACALGAASNTALCPSSSASAPNATAACGVCSIIHHGFDRADYPKGVRTTASSGRAHDCGPRTAAAELRAMLVCRVIAGRIRKPGEEPAAEDGYESVAGELGGQYGNLEELFVANPRAILPCFVVIYRALE